MIQKNPVFCILMWLFPLFFFSFQFILRLWPGLMMQPIMERFSIDASQFGLLAALYYYGYAGMQIPVAILLERFSVRWILFCFATLCGLATLLFTLTSSWPLACFSRFLIGAGSAVGFLGVSKVISEWFHKDHYAKMIGFSFTLGLLGAIYGGKPTTLLIETYSWKSVATGLGITSILIGCGTYLVLRSPAQSSSFKKGKSKETNEFKLSHFKMLFSSPFLWLLALGNLLMVGSLEGFTDVWGVPYLMTAYALEKSQAAQLISCVFIGMLFGGPLLAFLSKKWGSHLTIILCGLGMATAFSILLNLYSYHAWGLGCLLFAIGILCCYQVVVFAAGSEQVQPKELGVTVAFLNCINMLGGSFFHTLIGYRMDQSWDGKFSPEGLRQYELGSYQSSLVLIPLCALLGTGLICCVAFQKRFRCKG